MDGTGEVVAAVAVDTRLASGRTSATEGAQIPANTFGPAFRQPDGAPGSERVRTDGIPKALAGAWTAVGVEIEKTVRLCDAEKFNMVLGVKLDGILVFLDVESVGATTLRIESAGALALGINSFGTSTPCR